MALTKKPDARTLVESTSVSHLVAVPRTWLIVLAALVVLPWLVVAALYLYDARGAGGVADRENDRDGTRLLERADLGGELTILGEEEVVTPGDLSVEATVVESFERQAADGVYGVTELPEWSKQTLGDVLVEENPHETASSFE